MSKNKITRWIDTQNELISLRISGTYIKKKALTKPAFFLTVLKTLPLFIARLILLFAQFMRFNSALLAPYLSAIARKGGIKSTISELLLTLSGAKLFMKPEYTPEFYYGEAPDFTSRSSSVPLVSIIIPTHNQVDLTLTSLRALNYNLADHVPVEIIVVDESIENDTEELISSIPGVTYRKGPSSLGSYESRMQAVETAHGKYISILIPGYIIQKGWLENALQALEDDQSVDVVGSKVLYRNGILKEAGGIILGHGNRVHYGEYGHPAHHKYNFNRQVDFSSSAIFRKQVSECSYIPKIIYVCTSEIVDSTSASAQDNTPRIPKNIDELARKYVPRRSILVIDVNLPFYDKDSGSNRILHLLKIFKQLNYHVLFLPANGVATEPYYTLLRNLGIEVIAQYMGKSIWKNELVNCLPSVDICWLSRPELNRKFGYLFKINPAMKWIYDTVDLHYVRMMREAMLASDEQTKTNLSLQVEVYKTLETSLSKEADVTIAITQEEAENLSANGAKVVRVVPNIHVPQKGTDRNFAERHGIMFIGGFYHQPNVDAVIWLVNDIMPTVWQILSEVKLYLVGSNPPKEVLALANDRVIVTGYINDVSDYFSKSRIFVAPLRYGAGMKGKIGQALEYALPIVSTSIGTEGMNLENGVHVLEANTIKELQDSIIELYTNEELWERLHSNALTALKPLLFDYQKENVKELLTSLHKPYIVTIITVVKNAGATLQNLIDSVAKYKTPEVEFLVWDGQSTDGSLRILEENSDVVDHYVSLPDSGIYDALNQAMQLAKGEFFLFLGADDLLLEGFRDMLPMLKDNKTIYYGGVYMSNNLVSRPYSAYQLTKQHISHQSIIYPRAVFDKYTYDTRYNVFADYHLNIKCWTDPEFKLHYEDFTIAKFSAGGYSDVSQDINYTREKENWFRQYLSRRDYLRYMKRKLGYAGLFSEILGGLKPYILPEKESKRLSILFLNADFTGEHHPINPGRTLEMLCMVSRLNYEVVFLTPQPYFRDQQREELSNGGIRVIDGDISNANIAPLLDQVEFVWLLGYQQDKQLLNRIKKKRHIKRIFDVSGIDRPDERTIRISQESNISITETREWKEKLNSRGIFHTHQPDFAALRIMFNNLR